MIIPSRKKMIVSVTESMIENILPIAGHPFHQSILRLRFDCARLRSTFVDVTPPTDPEEKKKVGRGSKGGTGERGDSPRESTGPGVRDSV